MRIVIDTNVVASAIFFGGRPADLIKLVMSRNLEAVVTEEILEEYHETIDYLFEKYKGKPIHFSIAPLLSAMEIIQPVSEVKVCRDPDDDKFISCAMDGECLYIVSGDKDLLTLKEYQGLKIVAVTEFFSEYDFEL